MISNKHTYALGISLCVFCIPLIVEAQLIFSEIVYDLEGSDTDREWIEVFNKGTENILLTEWKFFESGVNHGLSVVSGSDTLSPGSYAVIADNTDVFLADNPSYNGVLVDSSFSLKNTGETLVLRDAELIDRDTVSYLSEWGAAGDGMSLQYDGNTWIAETPTPGTGSINLIGSSEEGESSSPQSSSPSSSVFIEDTGSIRAYAGEDRVVTVGADSEFKGIGFGLQNEPLEQARYLWAFGDGSHKDGEVVLHHYEYPGEYVVVLTVSSGKYSASDYIVVTAKPADVFVADASPQSITLRNESDRVLDISHWMLMAHNTVFYLPQGTRMLPKRSVVFPATVTGLTPQHVEEVTFLYPNGSLVRAFQERETRNLSLNAFTEHNDSPRVQTPSRSIVGTTVVREETTQENNIAESITPPEENPEDTSYNVANVYQASNDTSGIGIQWFLLLGGTVLFGVCSVLILRRIGREEITIIDE